MIRKILLATSLLLGATFAANAATVTVDATGDDNVDTAGFWGIALTDGTGSFVSSVTFDLTGTSGEHFDFDGSSSFDDATVPIFSGLIGILGTDITVSTSGGIAADHPQVLTLTFAAGSFGEGDVVRFGADVDQIVAGNDFVGSGAEVTASLEGSTPLSGSFVLSGSNASEVVLVFDDVVATVPLPAGMPLLVAALGALGFIDRRRKTA